MAEQRFRVTVPNRAPEAVGTIANRMVAVDRVVTLSVAAYFRDPDGEALEYSAVSSDPTRATVLASGSRLTLAGVAKGAAAVTVTARDPGGLAAEQRFRVTVPNRAPVAVGTIPDLELHVGDTVVVDVAPRFRDPDGDPLEYAIASSDTARVAVSGSGSVVAVWGAAVGSGTVTVTARDPEGLSAELRFVVSVPNRAPEAVDTIRGPGGPCRRRGGRGMSPDTSRTRTARNWCTRRSRRAQRRRRPKRRGARSRPRAWLWEP